MAKKIIKEEEVKKPRLLTDEDLPTRDQATITELMNGLVKPDTKSTSNKKPKKSPDT